MHFLARANISGRFFLIQRSLEREYMLCGTVPVTENSFSAPNVCNSSSASFSPRGSVYSMGSDKSSSFSSSNTKDSPKEEIHREEISYSFAVSASIFFTREKTPRISAYFSPSFSKKAYSSELYLKISPCSENSWLLQQVVPISKLKKFMRFFSPFFFSDCIILAFGGKYSIICT